MVYVAGVLSTTSQSTFTKTFMETVVHPKLLEAGFTYVEEVVGPTTNTCRIYKSSAAANGVADWYLIAKRASDNDTQPQFGACEDYDAVGHLAKRWCPGSSITGGQTLPADRSHYTTAGVAPYQATNSMSYIGLNNVSHSYILSLHPKRVIASAKNPNVGEFMSYAGLYDPIPGIANHFPLVVAGSYSNSTYPNTTYSREPGTGLSVSNGTGLGTFSYNQGLHNWPIMGSPYQVDGYLLKPTVVKILLPGSQQKGGYRGIAYGMYAATSNSFYWGDIAAANIDGVATTMTCVLSSGRMIDQGW